jgi:hypothetical protein
MSKSKLIIDSMRWNGMERRTHSLTIIFSANRERIGFTEISLRSLIERGRGIFEIIALLVPFSVSAP